MSCGIGSQRCCGPPRRSGLVALPVRLLTVLPIAALVTAVAYLRYVYVPPRPDDSVTWSSRPTVEAIQRLSHLVTTRVTISDVLTGEGDGVRGVWLIKGDAFLSIDLSSVEVLVIDRERRRAVIVLSPPAVLSARVDHERSVTWDIERTTWIPWRADMDLLRDQAYHHAQKLVEYAASRPERIEEAKRHAAHALTETYRPVDWSVEVRWREEGAHGRSSSQMSKQ